MSKNKKIRVKINNFTPLISDVLPYEIPYGFSNKNFYLMLKQKCSLDNEISQKCSLDNEISSNAISKIFLQYFNNKPKNTIEHLISDDKNKEFTIQYDYKIKKNENDTRTISIMHPLNQIKVCDFYCKYNKNIVYNCKKSNFSLRHPDDITKMLIKNNHNNIFKLVKNSFNEVQTKNFNQNNKETNNSVVDYDDLITSYFIYKKFKKIHEFYDSNKYRRLEEKFKLCLKIDISKCFNSIYTHSICWAMNNKEFAKLNAKLHCFENDFDKIMQKMNYNETHGILIGSEVSRIFSEIILQRIDLNVEKELEILNLNLNIDYSVYRYVDDIFIYSNNEEICNKIKEIYCSQLEYYKLYINDKKTQLLKRPFITDIGSAKIDIIEIINNFLNSYICSINNKKYIFHKNHQINIKVSIILNQIRNIIYKNNISSFEIINLVLSDIKYNLLNSFEKIFYIKTYYKLKEKAKNKDLSNKEKKELNNIKEKDYIDNDSEDIFLDNKQIKQYLLNIIEISFYLCSITIKFNSIKLLFEISYLITNFLESFNEQDIEFKEILNDIYYSIYQKTVCLLENISNSDYYLIESLTLITILQLKNIKQLYFIPSERLDNIFLSSKKEISYFEVVILLNYIEDKDSILKKKIIDKVKEKLQKNNDLKKTENFLLYFDLIKCPFLDKNEKLSILHLFDITEKETIMISNIDKDEWFFEWNYQVTDEKLEQIFKSKEKEECY